MEDKENGGELTDAPNANYQKFFKKFSEINTLPIADWKPVHVLSFFCKRYYQQYNVKYKFKFNSPAPGKCFEVFQIKRLASMLSANPKILKEYIDWVYDTKVIAARRRLTSISFMTVEGLVVEYKLKILMAPANDINRTTLLPEEYKKILLEAGFPINTYGDLCFVCQMPDCPPEIVNQLEMIGFNKSLLKSIV